MGLRYNRVRVQDIEVWSSGTRVGTFDFSLVPVFRREGAENPDRGTRIPIIDLIEIRETLCAFTCVEEIAKNIARLHGQGMSVAHENRKTGNDCDGHRYTIHATSLTDPIPCSKNIIASCCLRCNHVILYQAEWDLLGLSTLLHCLNEVVKKQYQNVQDVNNEVADFLASIGYLFPNDPKDKPN